VHKLDGDEAGEAHGMVPEAAAAVGVIRKFSFSAASMFKRPSSTHPSKNPNRNKMVYM